MQSPKTALRHDGMAVVPAFLDDAGTRELCGVVSAIYDEMDDATEFPHPDMLDHYRRWKGVSLLHVPAFLDRCPLLRDRFARIVANVERQARATMGWRWEYRPILSWFRRHVGMATKIPWHIDAEAAGASGDVFTVWMPIDRVGGRLPSLEVVPGSHDQMRRAPRLPSDDYVRDPGRSGVVPILNPGDALFFDNFTLHRTQECDRADVVRTSCEFRFWRPPLRHLASRLLRSH